MATDGQKARRLLYTSALLSAWGDRMWEFAVSLFMMDVGHNSLMLISIYGVTTEVAGVFLGPYVGRVVDRTPRLSLARSALVIQNLSVAGCAAILFLIMSLYVELQCIPGGATAGSAANNATGGDLCAAEAAPASGSAAQQDDSNSSTGSMRWELVVLVLAVIALGIVSNLASSALKVAVQKDWAVVVADSHAAPTDDSSAVLAGMNAMIRRIDLTCKVVAPIAVGFIYSYACAPFAAAFLAVWNVASVFVEYFLLRRVYLETPALAHRGGTKAAAYAAVGADETDLDADANADPEANAGAASAVAIASATCFGDDSIDDDDDDDDDGGGGGADDDNHHPDSSFTGGSMVEQIRHFFAELSSGWGIYLRQSSLRPAFALALLYMNVLSFGILMVGYLKAEGLSEGYIGLGKGLMAAFGITSTFAYSWHAKRFSIEVTALRAIIAQAVCLLPCVFAMFIQDLWTSAGLLVAGVVVSRIGLWSFDMSVTQIQQETVPEHERGTVGVVQNSVQQLMYLLHYAQGIIWHCPGEFKWLVFTSYGGVIAAMVLYATYHRKEAGKASRGGAGSAGAGKYASISTFQDDEGGGGGGGGGGGFDDDDDDKEKEEDEDEDEDEEAGGEDAVANGLELGVPLSSASANANANASASASVGVSASGGTGADGVAVAITGEDQEDDDELQNEVDLT